MNLAYCMDCMDAMRQMPDEAFDLAVVDPPYGDAAGGGARIGTGSEGDSSDTRAVNHARGGRFDRYSSEYSQDSGEEVRRKIIAWDVAPGKEYFDELFRVSRNQIIWGGNYFSLPPTRCFLVWRKQQIPDGFSMAMCEYAWTSFNANAKFFTCNSAGQQGRFHPTQKPVALYAWIYKNFAKRGYKILDTHLGSGSSRIAAYDAGLDFVGFEIDPDYFAKEEERFAAHTAQISINDLLGNKEGG